MDFLSKEKAIRLLYKKGISLFTVSDAKKIFEMKKQNTLYKLLQRLENSEIIKRIAKGKYQFLLTEANDFEIANFLVNPSYLSLETALSFYGILAQFPYTVTSVAIARGNKFIYNDKEFEFCTISKDYFFGFEKKENFLIAKAEKALIDELYFMSKGLRKVHLEDLDISQLNLKEFESMAKKFKFKPLNNLIKKILC